MIESTKITPIGATEGCKLQKEMDYVVTKNIAEKFIGALTELESSRDVEMLVALFADNCEVGNIVVSEKFQGLDGVRKFWTHYRATFNDVCSIFQNEVYSGNKAQLQWTTEGKSKNGRKIKYNGVSILKTENEKIKHFYAYFDPQVLKKQITGQIGNRT